MNTDRIMEPPPRRLDEVIDLLQERMPELRERYGVVSLGVFGSWTSRRIHRESDLDLLVELDDPSMSLLRFVALKHELSDLLGVPVDLVEKDGLKPTIGKRILGEVVYV